MPVCNGCRSRRPAGDLVTAYGGILLSRAGTACLITVVASSLKKARRRLRCESWHLLHLYAYLGVGLALPHQLWTGQAFLESRAATLFWWTLWAVAGGTIIIWRLLLPLARSHRHDLRVTAVVRESSDVVSVHLSGRRLDRLPGTRRAVPQHSLPGRHRLDPVQPVFVVRGPGLAPSADHREGGRRG